MAPTLKIVAVCAGVVIIAAACGGGKSPSASKGTAPTATAEDSGAGVRLPPGKIPGEITGPELGTSPATFRQEDGELIIELDEGALVYGGPIDADGRFGCMLVGQASQGTIKEIAGTITGDTIEGTITRAGEKPEKITGTLQQAASG